MSNEVTFVSSRPKEMRADATLPALLDRMMGKWNLKERFDGKTVAIKMHLGGGLGFSTIHPMLVRRVVNAVTQSGGKPFVTDASWAVFSAKERGYTAETLGCPIQPVAGNNNKYIYSRQVNYRSLETVELAGNIIDADAMIVLSHGKGHGQSGFGGAIKNLAMGCVDDATRGKIHRLTSSAINWDASKCTGCLLCRDNCPKNAIQYKDGKIVISDHDCKYCMHCQLACPNGAITIDPNGFEYFQKGMALTTREVLKTFEPDKVLFVTALLQITPFCDCWGFTTPSIVPDIGIVAGDDIVAVETAACDLIKAEDFIEGSLPAPLKRSGKGHLLEQIHGKDPYLQIRQCIELGMGNKDYRLTTVE